jgi:hypothetical protein
LLEDLDEVRADPPGGSRHGDPLARAVVPHRCFLSDAGVGVDEFGSVLV